MTEIDRRYYGYSEWERISRNIAKKERWISNHADNAQGCIRRAIDNGRLKKRLIELEEERDQSKKLL